MASASHSVFSSSTRIGNVLVRIELEKFLALPGRERRSEFKLDRRVQIARHGNREARIIVAAEIEASLCS